MDELDLADAEKKATYGEIREYVLEHGGCGRFWAILTRRQQEKYAVALDIDNLPEPPSCLEAENVFEESKDTLE